MAQILKGSTDVTRYVMLRDSTAGTPETNYTITDLDLQYTRNREEPSAKVDATALSDQDDAHSDNKAIQIDATSSPGLYRVDWPDAAFATGVDKVILVVSGAGLDPAVEEIELVDFSLEGQSAADLKDFADAGYDPSTNYIAGVRGTISASGTVDNSLADATADVFKTSLTDVSNAWRDQLLVFTSGALAGQARTILGYSQTNGVVTLSESLTAAPANGDSFLVLALHVHPVTQIATGVRTELNTELGRIDVAMSSLASQTSVNTIDQNIGTPANFGSGNSLALNLMDIVFNEAGTGSGTGYNRAVESLEGISNQITLANQILQADVTVNTASTPWELVYKIAGTSTVLFRKKLKDTAGTDLVSTSTVVGQQVE